MGAIGAASWMVEWNFERCGSSLGNGGNSGRHNWGIWLASNYGVL